MDKVSSYRTKAYCDYFASFGIKPTLLTHRWENVNGEFIIQKASDPVFVEEGETCTTISLPNPGVNQSKSKLHTLISYLNANFEVGLVDSYRIFKKFLWGHLKEKQYDVIIGIYNPHFHLKLAYECWVQFGIPYILDFRDLWENDIVTTSYKPTVKERLVNVIIKSYWKKWIRHSLFFSTTGIRWKEYLSLLSGREGVVVRNGLEGMLGDDNVAEHSKPAKFKVVHFGSMYKTQDLDVFLTGFRMFAEKHSPGEVACEIIGLKDILERNYEDRIRQILGPYVTFLPYLPKEQLSNYCAKEASLFFFPNFKEDNGQFPVKIYDYIAMGKNILVAPAGGEISDFVSEVSAGRVLDEPKAVAEYLKDRFEEFRNSGTIQFQVNKTYLEKYLRLEQVRIMAEAIHRGLQ